MILCTSMAIETRNKAKTIQQPSSLTKRRTAYSFSCRLFFVNLNSFYRTEIVQEFVSFRNLSRVCVSVYQESCVDLYAFVCSDGITALRLIQCCASLVSPQPHTISLSQHTNCKRIIRPVSLIISIPLKSSPIDFLMVNDEHQPMMQSIGSYCDYYLISFGLLSTSTS